MPTTDLARRIDPASYGLPSEPTTNAAAISRMFAEARAQGCNLVGAETTISYVPPGYSVVCRLVRFDADAPKTWYKTDDGFALSFVALSQLAALAGITWEVSEPIPVPRGERHLWRHRAQASQRLIDGTRRTVIETAELDLRSDRPEDSGCKSPMMLAKKRQKGAAHCASSAKARVLRQLLGIRTYTQAEQAKPFVVVTLAWIPPVGNPEVDRMVAAAELGIVSQVYGRSAPRALPAPALDIEEADFEEEGELEPVRQEVKPEPRQERAPDQTRREPDPWDAGEQSQEEQHHPSWPANQRAFFAALTALGKEWNVEIRYDDVKEWCKLLGKPKPSALAQEDRVRLLAFLGTPKGRNSLESVIHTGALP